MNGRERVRRILRGGEIDRAGYWPGNPTPEAKAIYARGLGLSPPPESRDSYDTWEDLAEAVWRHIVFDIDLTVALGSDLHWCCPEMDPSAWRPPGAVPSVGRPLFDSRGENDGALDGPGRLAECEDPGAIDSIAWPDPRHLDFTLTLRAIDEAHRRDLAVLGGMWAPFFHILCDFFGMEAYLVKMLTEPEIVDAVTERVVAFYLEANRRFLDVAADRLEAYFFGNDLGSQRDLLISPELFDRFVRPGFQRLVDQAHEYGLPVVLHSCGSVSKIIPRLIETGIDGLHPIQALAAGMDAESLAAGARDCLVFIGGIDTQDLLPHRSPAAIRAEVRRLLGLFGKRWIVSPSHEALLENVPLGNVLAMRDGVIG